MLSGNFFNQTAGERCIDLEQTTNAVIRPFQVVSFEDELEEALIWFGERPVANGASTKDLTLDFLKQLTDAFSSSRLLPGIERQVSIYTGR